MMVAKKEKAILANRKKENRIAVAQTKVIRETKNLGKGIRRTIKVLPTQMPPRKVGNRQDEAKRSRAKKDLPSPMEVTPKATKRKIPSLRMREKVIQKRMAQMARTAKPATVNRNRNRTLKAMIPTSPKIIQGGIPEMSIKPPTSPVNRIKVGTPSPIRIQPATNPRRTRPIWTTPARQPKWFWKN